MSTKNTGNKIIEAKRRTLGLWQMIQQRDNNNQFNEVKRKQKQGNFRKKSEKTEPF
jgi:hypothetical protein